jgi:hypothetical protein
MRTLVIEDLRARRGRRIAACVIRALLPPGYASLRPSFRCSPSSN